MEAEKIYDIYFNIFSKPLLPHKSLLKKSNSFKNRLPAHTIPSDYSNDVILKYSTEFLLLYFLILFFYSCSSTIVYIFYPTMPPCPAHPHLPASNQPPLAKTLLSRNPSLIYFLIFQIVIFGNYNQN